MPDGEGGTPGSQIGNGSSRRNRRHPSLRIGGEVFSWDWVPRWASCFGCGSTFRGEGYGGPDRTRWRVPDPGSVTVVVLCEACALQRAQGSVGVALVDGESRQCRVRSWDPAEPESLEIALDDLRPSARQDRDRLIIRRVPVAAFQPERTGGPGS
jgi:hypothetical protein